MKKSILQLIIYCCLFFNSKSQELFVYTEPASNMATGTLGFRMTSSLMKEKNTAQLNFYMLPEIMFGISKKIMIHADGFISNRNQSLASEGGALYLKYRLISNDDVHAHFRLALFSRYAFNNSEIHQPAIDLNGHNSGFEFGSIATKLINKLAISSSVGYVYGSDNINKPWLIEGATNRRAINFTASIGKLFFPKEYISYDQLNVNGMLEILGQSNIATGKTYLDFAPSVQFIIKSRMRVDVGYRFAVSNELVRTSPNGGLFRFEYNIFNALSR